MIPGGLAVLITASLHLHGNEIEPNVSLGLHSHWLSTVKIGGFCRFAIPDKLRGASDKHLHRLTVFHFDNHVFLIGGFERPIERGHGLGGLHLSIWSLLLPRSPLPRNLLHQHESQNQRHSPSMPPVEATSIPKVPARACRYERHGMSSLPIDPADDSP
jgi:hypothetical protein